MRPPGNGYSYLRLPGTVNRNLVLQSCGFVLLLGAPVISESILIMLVGVFMDVSLFIAAIIVFLALSQML